MSLNSSWRSAQSKRTRAVNAWSFLCFNRDWRRPRPGPRDNIDNALVPVTFFRAWCLFVFLSVNSVSYRPTRAACNNNNGSECLHPVWQTFPESVTNGTFSNVGGNLYALTVNHVSTNSGRHGDLELKCSHLLEANRWAKERSDGIVRIVQPTYIWRPAGCRSAFSAHAWEDIVNKLHWRETSTHLVLKIPCLPGWDNVSFL